MAILCPVILLVLACESREVLGGNDGTQSVLNTALPALKMTMRMNSHLNDLIRSHKGFYSILNPLQKCSAFLQLCIF